MPFVLVSILYFFYFEEIYENVWTCLQPGLSNFLDKNLFVFNGKIWKNSETHNVYAFEIKMFTRITKIDTFWNVFS